MPPFAVCPIPNCGFSFDYHESDSKPGVPSRVPPVDCLRCYTRLLVACPHCRSSILETPKTEGLVCTHCGIQARDMYVMREVPTEHNSRWPGFCELVGRSPKMQAIYNLIEKMASCAFHVLIYGESGTGKELVARSIHSSSGRQDRPFVPVDCSSFVPTLIESELFGHVKGAFTGATLSKQGLLAAAQGGTLFLDEIGELPLDLQAKLLRAVQEKEFKPVGANSWVGIEARLIAATNRDLKQAVLDGRFRRDLFYRLNVVDIRVPSLRERRSDIPLLVSCFLNKLNGQRFELIGISEGALRQMQTYDWPGNVRELQNACEYAVAHASGPVLELVHLPESLRQFSVEADYSFDDESLLLQELKRRAMAHALERTGGHRIGAARLMGVSKSTFYRWLKRGA